MKASADSDLARPERTASRALEGIAGMLRIGSALRAKSRNRRAAAIPACVPYFFFATTFFAAVFFFGAGSSSPKEKPENSEASGGEVLTPE